MDDVPERVSKAAADHIMSKTEVAAGRTIMMQEADAIDWTRDYSTNKMKNKNK